MRKVIKNWKTKPCGENLEEFKIILLKQRGFPGGTLVVKNLPANAGNPGSVPGSERSPGGGHGSPLQYSRLENFTDKEPGGLQSIGSPRVRHD